MNSISDIGKAINNYRKQKDLTQDELAERIGWKQAGISQLERGKRKFLSLADLEQIAVALEVEPEDFLFWPYNLKSGVQLTHFLNENLIDKLTHLPESRQKQLVQIIESLLEWEITR